MDENFCLIRSFYQGQNVEIAVNMRYFKRAFYDSYSSNCLLVLEFADFKIYHECKKRISLEILINTLKGNEINLQNLE